MPSGSAGTGRGGRGCFATTQWSMVLAAGKPGSTGAEEALARLCSLYWYPIFAFARRHGYSPDDAQDLTQSFFTRMLEKNDLGDADPARGRFRSFLLTAVKNFLANEWDRARTLKRGGGQVTVSLDVVKAERWYVPSVVDAETPEVLFERRWALSVLEQAMLRLRADFAAARKSDLFEYLSVFLSQDSSEIRYAELAGQLGMRAGTVRTKVYRMREKYRKLLREEISETVSTAAEIDDEIRFLVSRLIE